MGTTDVSSQTPSPVPPHNWCDWYPAYLSARLAGSSQDEASAGAGRYMAQTKLVLPL